MYNDFWMHDQGFLRGPLKGDLRDVMSRSSDEGTIVSVGPSDTLLMAYTRMKLYDVSQLPVLEEQAIVGLIDESDLLFAVHLDETAFKKQVREFMTKRLVTVQCDADLESLLPLFDHGLVVILCQMQRFLGLITRIDVLNYLRRKLK
jgi:cystathionine beta-synthase